MKYKILFSALFLSDIISKFIVTEYLKLPLTFSEYFSFKLVINRGAAFGILSGQRVLLIIVALFALCFLYYYFLKASPKLKYFFVMVMAGTAGNLIDRVTTGGIIDFIDVGVKDLRWPTFNLADSYIMLGVILILFFHKEFEKKPAETEC